MPSPSFDASLVRILTDNQEPRRPIGAGFLVTPKHILTCAHVVNDALGRKQNAADHPDVELFLDFPLLKDQCLIRAIVLHWFPIQEDVAMGDPEDIAVLELLPETHPPAEARPAPVVEFTDQLFADRLVRMFGFSVSDGTYANLLLEGLNAKGLVEMHHQGRGEVKPGFSGTAAWAVQENAVCGMVVGRLGQMNTAYMIPASVLIAAFPEIKKFSRPANPYRGLESFREEDARFYFGRESDAAALREKVAQQPFTAVIGASGSGKSSLVLAGVIPALRRTGDWLIADCRPKKQPFYELSSCLIPLLYDDELEVIKRTRQCAADLRAGELSLSDLIRRIVQKKGAHRFLLVVDQFEELYTLNEDTEARCFIDLLLEAGETEILSAVITMRADFLETALHYGVFAEALKKTLIIVPPISEDGLRQAVEKPAELFKIGFASGLIDLIIRDVGQEPGSLPLLEFCLTQLWERQEFRRISHDAYKAIGGVQQALANHADAVYAEFTEQEREQLRHIFLKLVRPGQGTEDTRQVANLEQIRAEDRTLITRLADKRLIVTGRDEEHGEETVEVVHEALIRRWQTLRQWVNEEREFLVWQEKLRGRVQDWQDSEQDEGALLRGLPLDEALRWWKTHAIHLTKDEQEFIAAGEAAQIQQRRKKNIAISTVLFLAAIMAMTFFLLWNKAERQKVVAEQERQHAVEQSKVAERNAVEAKKQTLEANYNLAKAFEEKASRAFTIATEKQYVGGYKTVVLMGSAALEQEVAKGKEILDSNSIGRLFLTEVFSSSLAEQWASPARKLTKSNVFSVSFSPDGTWLASADLDNTVRLWNVTTGKEQRVFHGHKKGVTSVSFSPDGKQLASASNDKTIRLWDIASGRELAIFKGHTDFVNSVVFSPDGTRLASASNDNTVRLWDISTGRELSVFKGHTNSVSGVSFSPDGTHLASASWDNTVQLRDIETEKKLIIFKGHSLPVLSVSFSPDGKQLASASVDKTVRLWNVDSEKELAILRGHTKPVNCVSFSPDGKQLASASWDTTVRLWDFNTGIELTILTGHTEGVQSVSFSPDGKQLVSSSRDTTIRLWTIINNEIRSMVISKGKHAATDVATVTVSSDGKRLVTDSRNDRIRLWNIETGKEIGEFKGNKSSVTSISFSPDGKKIAASFYNKTIKLWDIASSRKLSVFKGHADSVNSVVFSPDGILLASVSDDKTVRLWDIASGRELSVFKGFTDSVNSVAFSPDRTRLALASKDKTVRLWDIKAKKEMAIYRGHTGDITNLSFSPDSRTLASASEDKTVRLWDIETAKELNVLKGHVGDVRSVSFSPDGKWLASASWDNTMRLWDSVTAKEVMMLQHGANVENVSFSPDGRRLVTVSWGAFSSKAIAYFWDLRACTLFLHNSKPTPLYTTPS